MKKFLLLALLLTLPGFSQSKKYQSLLWEVSGNGLQKKTYLYGSMHVSDKVSYHLSDAFFTHLLASDYVATESDPETWIDLYDALSAADPSLSNIANDGFYSGFTREPLTKDDLRPLFINNSNVVNNILSRTNENQKDYQEDTYLDMFIYQTGRKYKKKTVGLENAKTSMLSIMTVENAADGPRIENRQAIMRLLRDRSLNEAMLDFYREKNLDMLDSLYVLATPAAYHKALITDRNLVMLKSIDSLAHKGSLFAAVGAAHLPGKKGIIELLRAKGYTVKPVVDAYTEKGQKTKKTIDSYFSRPSFSITKTSDDMVTLPLPTSRMYNSEDISAPDLANGGIVNLKRMPLRNFLRKNDNFNAATLDSLFYENIPGNIAQKKTTSDENGISYDITSRTKIGNSQHYRYYVTPLEIICVSMGGNGSYVRQYENEIYPNIKLKKNSLAWETITPEKGGFSVSVPAYHTLYGNRTTSPRNIEVNAYDSAEKAYYFAIEQTVKDNETLEQTAFELKRIHDEFYRNLGTSATAGNASASGDSYESAAVFGQRKYKLKTVIDGQKYYLLGAVDASEENTKKFFGSFRILPFVKDGNFKKLEDYKGHFSMSVPEKENERQFWKFAQDDAQSDSDAKNLFKTNDKQYTFLSRSGKTVDLFAWSYHRYDYVENRDTLVANIKRNILSDYNQDDEYEKAVAEEEAEAAVEETDSATYEEPTRHQGIPESTWEKTLKPSIDKKERQRQAELTGVKESYDPNFQLIKIEATAQRPDCLQAVKYVAFVQDGYIWYLRSILPKGQKEPDFIDQLSATFEPLTSAPDYSLFEKKTALFIEDASSENDSIRYSAFQSVDLLLLDKSDLPTLKEFLTSFEFRPEETTAVSRLLEKIGKIDDPMVVPFLENCYRKDGVNAIVQLAIIRALAKQESKKAYEKIADLLEFDLPLSANDSDIGELFSLFAEDSENSKILYPGVFQYYGVSEYQDPIVEFTTKLIREKKVNPKKIKSYKKLLLADARLQTKRASVGKARQATKDEDYYFESPSESLKNYANLLYGFKSDKAVAEWFSKTQRLALPEVNLELLKLDMSHGKKPQPEAAAVLFENPETRFLAYSLFLDEKQLLPNWDDAEIARAVAQYFQDDKNEKLAFLEKRDITVEDKPASLFFFKRTGGENASAYKFSSDVAKLVTIGFLLDKNGKIDPKAWKEVNSVPLQDEMPLAKQYDIVTDRLLNAKHSRASFAPAKVSANSFYGDDDY